MGMLPIDLGMHRGGCRSVAFKGRMVWEPLLLARGGLGLVCRWLFGEGERRGRYCVRAKQIPFAVHGRSPLSLQTWLLICGS